MSSDEADRRRTYAELERRGQKTPGKYFGPSTPKLRVKKTPEVKTIDMTKMKQLKLFRLGGLASADPFGDKRRQESARTMAKLKKGAKTAKKIRTKPIKISIQSASITTPKGMSIEKNTIMPKMAKEGGLMTQGNLRDAIAKVKAKEMEKGGEAVPSKFKGFSKLPEEVQKKMDPALAERFEDGGPVKMGSGGGVCKGMGMARAGGKFKIR